MTVFVVEHHDLLVDLLLPEHRHIVLHAAVREAGVLDVESVQVQRSLGENVFLKNKEFQKEKYVSFSYYQLLYEPC